MPLWVPLLLLAGLAASGQSGDRPSLEEFRRQVRERRAAARAELEPRVAALVARVEALPVEPDPDLVEELQRELGALPPEAAPLLVPRLDPGAAADPAGIAAAHLIRDALLQIGLRGITPELAALAESGSALGSPLALGLLARSDDVEDAGRALRALWSRPDPVQGRHLARALLELGGEENRRLVTAVLSGDSRVRTAWAVAALAEVDPPETALVLGELLARGTPALPQLDPVLEYFRGHPDAFTESDAASLLRLAGDESVPREHRLAILEALPELRRGARPAWLEQLRDAAQLSSGPLREAMLVCLARTGDRAARKEVLGRSEAWVDRAERTPEAYIERARILMLLRDHDRAASDYGRAFDLVRAPLDRRREIGLLLARAQVLGGNLRQAALVLEKIRLSPVLARELAADPDFAALRDHPRYGRVLQ